MAFPGIFNINYYKGDTYEFNVYPKTTSGEPFDMTDYTLTRFTVSSVRGDKSLAVQNASATLSLNEELLQIVEVSSQVADLAKPGMKLIKKSGVGEFGENAIITAIFDNKLLVSVEHETEGNIVFDIDERYDLFADFSEDRKYIKCAIQPSIGKYLDSSKNYIYDVEISKFESPYDKIFTLLTGQIALTEQVSFDRSIIEIPEIEVSVPNAPTGPLEITEDPAGTINLSWSAPTGGDPATSYKIYGKSDFIPGLGSYIQIATTTSTSYSANSVTIAGTSYPLQTGIQYDIKVTAVNSAGESASGIEESITLAVPSTEPGSVSGLAISARDFAAGTATIQWTAPTSGATVTSYVVAYNDNPQVTDTPLDFVPVVPPLSSGTLTYNFTGLTSMTPYAFAVIPYAGEVPGTPSIVVDGA